MKIEVGKTYLTNTKARVRIICIDRWDNSYPIVGLSLRDGGTRFSGEGVVYLTECGELGISTSSVKGERIVSEQSPWDDVPMDTLVWVRNNDDSIWRARYFYKVIDGAPRMFDGGTTSKTILDGPQHIENVSERTILSRTSSWTQITTTRPHGY